MANRSKKKGTEFESKVAKRINEYVGIDVAERMALHGQKDRGDLRLDLGELVLTIECKDYKAYPSEGQFKDFIKQTVNENEHAGQDGGVLIVNLYNKSLDRAQVWMELSTLYKLRMRMLGIDMDRLPEGWDQMIRDGDGKWVMVPFWRFLAEYVGRCKKGN